VADRVQLFGSAAQRARWRCSRVGTRFTGSRRCWGPGLGLMPCSPTPANPITGWWSSTVTCSTAKSNEPPDPVELLVVDDSIRRRLFEREARGRAG